MAFLDVHAFSDSLGLQVAFHVFLPQQSARQIGVSTVADRKVYPALWLLHGLSDDHTICQRRTCIERYAEARGLAVVMPAVGRSYYQDQPGGARYWTWLTEELPALCRAWFPLSAAREDNFAAGLSMGGYGALRMALAFPDRYAAGASLSGALNLSRRLRDADKVGGRLSKAELIAIFGPELNVDGTSSDLFHLATEVARSAGPKPNLFLWCGQGDELLDDSRLFRRHLQSVGLAHHYSEGPGTHEWGCWEREIQRILSRLPLRGAAATS